MHYATPYRVAATDYTPFAEDFTEGAGEAAVDRDSLLATLRRFAEVNEVKVAWNDIKKASNEALVNGLSMMSPCGPREKQALLEAQDLRARGEMLVAITTIGLARGDDAGNAASLDRDDGIARRTLIRPLGAAAFPLRGPPAATRGRRPCHADRVNPTAEGCGKRRVLLCDRHARGNASVRPCGERPSRSGTPGPSPR